MYLNSLQTMLPPYCRSGSLPVIFPPYATACLMLEEVRTSISCPKITWTSSSTSSVQYRRTQGRHITKMSSIGKHLMVWNSPIFIIYPPILYIYIIYLFISNICKCFSRLYIIHLIYINYIYYIICYIYYIIYKCICIYIKCII